MIRAHKLRACAVRTAAALLLFGVAGQAFDWNAGDSVAPGISRAEAATPAPAAAGSAVNVKLSYAAAKQTVKAGARVWLRDKLTRSEDVEVTYAIGNPAIARVEPNGLLTGISAGTTKVTIQVASQGYTGTLALPIEVAAAASVAAPKHASTSVMAGGRTFGVRTVTIPKGTPVTSGIAGKAVGQVQSLKAIAANYLADVAVNGTFFEAYGGPTDPYGTIVSDGEFAHVGNTGTTIGFKADGSAIMDTLRVRILGSTNGSDNWAGNWYAYFINRTPAKGSTSAVLFTPKRGSRIGFAYGTAITVTGGVVTKIERDVNAAIPKNGFVVVFLGSEEKLASRFKVGEEAAYRIETNNAKGSPLDWKQVHTAIGAGPRLVTNGAVTLDAAGEGFRDAKIVTSSGARSGIGIKKDGSIILATVPGATMKQWALIMQKLGAYQAMNLDGGASSGLYVNGKNVTAEGRLLSNALLFGVKLRY